MNAPTEVLPPEVIRAEAVITPEAALAMRASQGTIAVSEGWTVDCAEMAEFVTGEVIALEGKAKWLDTARKSITDPLRKALDAANGLFMPAIKDMNEAAGIGRAKLLTWKRAEDARIADERRKAEEIARAARQKAEAEAAAARARAEEEARVARQRAAEAEAARAKAEAEGNARAAAAAAAQAAAANAKADAAIENGAAKAQDALIEAAAAAPVVVAPAAMPKGTGSRQKWEANLKDGPDALLLAARDIVNNHPAFIGLLSWNQSAANQLAGSLKSALVIDGVRVENVGSLTIRSK